MAQLFIGPSCLGDAILTTGLVERMLQDAPDEGITIACGPVAALVFRLVPRLERLHVMHKRRGGLHWLALWRATARRRWRRVVDMRRSALPWLLRADARHILPRARADEHRVVLNARTLGLPPLSPHIWLDDASRQRAAALLPAGRPVLALGTGANWICKTWPAARYAELARRMVGPGGLLAGGQVLLVGSPDERAQAEPVLRALPPGTAVEAFGIPLADIAAALARSALFVGNDSAMMHLAAAVGAPTIGLFGPTPDRSYGPWGANGLVVRTAEPMEALLAELRRTGVERCLMEGLSVDAVLDAAARRWPALAAPPLPAAAAD